MDKLQVKLPEPTIRFLVAPPKRARLSPAEKRAAVREVQAAELRWFWSQQ